MRLPSAARSDGPWAFPLPLPETRRAATSARFALEITALSFPGPRDWPLDPGVAEALRRWRKLQPKGARFVFSDEGKAPLNTDHMADTLRDALLAVGVDRRELHETTKTRRQIGVHDLRGTFVTLSLAAGRSEEWITRRAGHTTSAMLRRYRRHAANMAEGGEAMLAPLHLAIPELSAGSVSNSAGAATAKAAIQATEVPEIAAFSELVGATGFETAGSERAGARGDQGISRGF